MKNRMFTLAFANAATAPAEAPKASKPRVAPVITGTFAGIPIPATAKMTRGSKSPYPFDTLAAGEAFGLKNKTAKQMSSIVSNQNRRKENQTPRKDANGNPVFKMVEQKAPDGSVIGSAPDTTQPETDAIKEFRAVDVAGELKSQIKGTPLEGSTVLVFRIK